MLAYPDSPQVIWVGAACFGYAQHCFAFLPYHLFFSWFGFGCQASTSVHKEYTIVRGANVFQIMRMSSKLVLVRM